MVSTTKQGKGMKTDYRNAEVEEVSHRKQVMLGSVLVAILLAVFLIVRNNSR